MSNQVAVSNRVQEEVVIVGRINRDVEVSDSSAKLTDATITIESSRMHSSGYRLPLRFEPNLKIRGGIQGAGSLGLFPGAMVAVKGKNGGAGFFLASEIYAVPSSVAAVAQLIPTSATTTTFRHVKYKFGSRTITVFNMHRLWTFHARRSNRGS